MSLLYGPSQGTAKANLLAALRDTGGVRLEAAYSGGNDEGGVDGVKVFDAKGEQIEVPDTILRPRKDSDGSWVPVDENGMVQDYHPIWEAADAMLATEFYTWAGEFSAWGTLYATTADGRVWREGSYEVPSESESSHEY